MRRVPVFCNVLCATREEALAVTRGDIRLEYCNACGLVFNGAFDESLVRYSGQYENALHFSAHFRQYAEDLARELVESYGLRGKRIVELGCGDGSFLSALCRIGDNRGVGFDPAFDAARAGEVDRRVSIEKKLYGPETAGEPADFVCCRHVLEHISRPLGFVRHVRKTVGNRAGTVVFFEVPDVSWTLEQMGIWDIIYEHCNYFSRVAMRRVFAAGGFEPMATTSVYGGQFLTIRARPREMQVRFDTTPDAEDQHFRTLVDRFGERQKGKVAEWRGRLSVWARQGKRAVLWGAGSKGVTFLNTVGLGEGGEVREVGSSLSHIVDVNPRKQGCYVAGSGQEIVGPEALRSLKPDVVVIMNPVYRSEIEGQLRGLGVGASILEA
jgi:hypothetical protein